jgi:hypothetical protein
MAFASVDGRWVVADVAGGAITSTTGALLLGAAARAIRLSERLAACFTDGRAGDRVVHDLSILGGQRMLCIAPSKACWLSSSRESDRGPSGHRWPGGTWSTTTTCATIR